MKSGRQEAIKKIISENEIKFVVKSNAGNFDYIDIYSKDTLSMV